MPSISIDTSVVGNQTLVAAQGANKIISVIGLNLTSNGVCTVTLLSGAVTLWKSYATASAGGGIVLPDAIVREMNCAPNQALVLNLSAAVAVAGTITYTVLGS